MLSHRFFSMSSASDGHGFLPDVDGEEANRLDANSRRGDDDAPPLWLASPPGRGCRKQESIDQGYQESHDDQHVVPVAVPGPRRRRQSDNNTPGERRATNIACRTGTVDTYEL
jgi:hypothetical protein